jgi:hypothetical protein
LPAFSSPEDIARWLADKPRDVAVVLAARVALRVIPLARTLHLDRLTLLRAFRRAVAGYPGQAALLRSAARSAASRGHNAAQAKLESATGWASAAAGAASDKDALRFASHVVTYATAAADDAASQARDDILKSCAADADELDRGSSAVTLALSSTLWPGQPNWAFDAWAGLEGALLDAKEDWEVWTDWYEARLKAGPADQVVEVARATISNQMWQQGPKVVNGQIRQMFEERGIWRHATMDEPSPEDVKTDELQKALEALSEEGRALIGARVAARAVSLFTFGSAADPDFEADLLLMMRTVSTAMAAGTGRSAFPVPHSEALKSKIGILRAAANAVSASADALFPTDMIASGIVSLRSVFVEANGDVAATAFDAALSRDISGLASSTPAAVGRVPLLEQQRTAKLGGSQVEYFEG